MGQRIGTPVFQEAVEPFLRENLKACDLLFNSWCAHAEDYFVSIDEFRTICTHMVDLTGIKSELTNKDQAEQVDPVDLLFRKLAGEDGQLDMLHVLVPMALLADSEPAHVLPFLFKCFDIAATGRLNISEFIHAFKVRQRRANHRELVTSHESSNPFPDLRRWIVQMGKGCIEWR